MSAKVNLVMEQGATFLVELNLRHPNSAPFDMSSYTSRGQMRRHYNSSTSYAFITNAYANGLLTIGMSAANTAQIEEQRYVYDIEIEDASNTVIRVVEGTIQVAPEVTR